LDIHSEKGILVGFESTNYLIYIPKRRTIISTRDIKIIEDSKYIESINIEDEDYNYNNLPSYTNSEILTQEVNNEGNDSISSNNEDSENLESSENSDENAEISENRISINIPRRSTRTNKGIRRDLAQMASKAYISLEKEPEQLNSEIKES
jgi:hypothetical protein